MDWGQSYTAQWRIFKVNRKTWADAEQVENVDSVSVTGTTDGDLLQSGSMEVSGEIDADYYRVVMTAEQGGEVERVNVATLLFISSEGETNYGTTKHSANGYSVLYPASVTTIVAGEYAPAGVDGAGYAGELLREAINAPVHVEGHFTLNEDVVHEIGSAVLSAVWSVLSAGPDGGFCMQIDGRGEVHIRPMPKEPSLYLDNNNARLLQNGIEHSLDTSEVPNRYIVLTDIGRTIVANNSENSEISTVSRGYYVDEVDESPVFVNGETVEAYAVRKLTDLSVVRDTHSYKREYAPDVNLFSVVRASLDGLEGDLRVIEQTIECAYGITVEEKADREVRLWP